MNLAIISPSQNSYSETFIQAHKKIEADKISFYYGGNIPNYLEGKGVINIYRDMHNLKDLFRLILKINIFSLFKGKLSIREHLFAKSLKKEKVDVVLAEFGPTGVACMKVCKSLEIPLITHFHGHDITAGLTENKDAYKELIKYTSFVVGVSKEMVQTLIELGAPKEKVIYTPCGPNPKFYNNIPNFTSKCFISIGRFVDKKAPYYTILAFKEVIKEHPDAILYMIGDGPLLPTCKNLIRYFNLQNNVKLLGIKSPDEIQKLYNESIGFIQHSITAENGDKEGTPVVVMEAGAASLPVISTYHAGIADVIIDKKTGLLCNEHDVKTMANNILWILSNKSEAKEMGKAAKKRIQQEFSLQKHLAILSDTVRKANRAVK